MFEQLISSLAPHICIRCQQTGSIFCHACRGALAVLPRECHICHRIACTSCLAPLGRVLAATTYEGHAKELVHRLKFQRARAGAIVIARIMADRMPQPDDTDLVVSFIPTVAARMRVRGFDQAALIARHFASLQNLACVSLLHRLGKQRQVGQTKATRGTQLRNAFEAYDPALIRDKHIVLIDDVLTTGATVRAAAAVLYEAGAKRVDAVVFAAVLSQRK